MFDTPSINTFPDFHLHDPGSLLWFLLIIAIAVVLCCTFCRCMNSCFFGNLSCFETMSLIFCYDMACNGGLCCGGVAEVAAPLLCV